jgi:hypothetical protein
MAASEQASLAAYARAVLARSVQDNPAVARLELVATVDAGEIAIDVTMCDHGSQPLEGWGV